MAQNISLWGATYSDVPAVELPKSGGGTASFFDVTDTTAEDDDVAQGKVFLSSDGTLTIGTAMSTEMTILSYGNSTWDNFISAYNTNTIVYCRASSGSNPASGAQTRMAFMAYINADPPTEVEFQYYRSVSSHSASQQGDQVFVYKLNKNSGWSVTTREASTKIVAGTGLSSSYSSGTLTLTASIPSAADTAPVMDGTAAIGSSTEYAREDHVHPTDTSRAPLASPALTGTPTAPTATVGTDTTQIATTAFVTGELDDWVGGKLSMGSNGRLVYTYNTD